MAKKKAKINAQHLGRNPFSKKAGTVSGSNGAHSKANASGGAKKRVTGAKRGEDGGSRLCVLRVSQWRVSEWAVVRVPTQTVSRAVNLVRAVVKLATS